MPDRNPGIENLLRAMSPVGLSPGEAVEQNICAMCGDPCDPNKDLRDGLSVKEWFLSAMCQACQDRVFLQGDIN